MYEFEKQNDFFAQVNWRKMKRGFELMNERHPSAWNLGAFCFFACQAGDRETAAALFGQLGDRYSNPIWDMKVKFDNWKKWALGDGPRPKE